MKKILSALSLALVAGAASASTIQIQTGAYSGSGSFASASEYQAAVNSAVSAIGATSTFVSSFENLPIALNNGALKATLNFGVSTAGVWDFRAGVDFGKGGAVYLDGVAMASKSNDMWWSGNYNNPSQFFSITKDITVGNHSLTIYGIENCCSGNQQVQFKAAGSSSFVSFGNTDGLVAAVPEPETYAMLLAGLGLMGAVVKRRKVKQA